MYIEPCSSLKTWNEWLEQTSSITPLVAHGNWAEILRQEGLLPEFFFLKDAAEILGGFMIISKPGHLAPYAYSPRTPIFLNHIDLPRAYLTILDFLKKRTISFWRIEPPTVPSVQYSLIKTTDIQPATTLVLDLNQTPDQLLLAMHQKTRYNIRLAHKKNLEIRWEKNVPLFWELSTQTSNRDGFRLHGRAHYETVIINPHTEQLTVYAHNTPIASAVFMMTGSTYTYLYGASSYEARALMAPYLIQWHGIEHAQQHQFRWYDFYGLAPLEHPLHTTQTMTPNEYIFDPAAKEAGYTRFKLGFGGAVISTPGTWDIPLHRTRYHLYRIARSLRRRLSR